MNIGYVRVSTEAQDPNGQLAALKAVCDEIHTEYASGGRWDRPCLQNVLRHIKAGDVLVVWKLDRLSRSLSDLLNILKRLDEVGAGFRSLTEAIDTTTAAGRMMLQMLGAFAEFERTLIRDRIKAGLARAKAKGVKLGRAKVHRPSVEREVRERLAKGEGMLKISRSMRIGTGVVVRVKKEMLCASN